MQYISDSRKETGHTCPSKAWRNTREQNALIVLQQNAQILLRSELERFRSGLTSFQMPPNPRVPTSQRNFWFSKFGDLGIEEMRLWTFLGIPRIFFLLWLKNRLSIIQFLKETSWRVANPHQAFNELVQSCKVCGQSCWGQMGLLIKSAVLPRGTHGLSVQNGTTPFFGHQPHVASEHVRCGFV